VRIQANSQRFLSSSFFRVHRVSTDFLLALSNIGILSGTPKELTVAQGLMMLAACLPIAVVGLVSAMHQGKTAVAAVGIVVKKPDQFGKAMLFPAMVETYAILALLVSILAVNGIKL